MNYMDLFNLLRETKKITIEIDAKGAESLRVRLSNLWSQYKREAETIGILEDSDKELSLSIELDKQAGTATYYLRPRIKKPLIEFKVVNS